MLRALLRTTPRQVLLGLSEANLERLPAEPILFDGAELGITGSFVISKAESNHARLFPSAVSLVLSDEHIEQLRAGEVVKLQFSFGDQNEDGLAVFISGETEATMFKQIQDAGIIVDKAIDRRGDFPVHRRHFLHQNLAIYGGLAVFTSLAIMVALDKLTWGQALFAALVIAAVTVWQLDPFARIEFFETGVRMVNKSVTEVFWDDVVQIDRIRPPGEKVRKIRIVDRAGTYVELEDSLPRWDAIVKEIDQRALEMVARGRELGL